MRTLLLTLLALVTAARADVVVYRGTGTCLVKNSINQYGPAPHLYYIVDLATRESFPIFYYTLNGQKKKSISFPLAPTRYTASPDTNGRTLGNFTFLFDDGGTTNYGVIMFYLRGRQTAVQLSSSKSGNFPTTLTGIYRGASHSGPSSFIDEINLVLTFDSFQTQTANNAGKSGQDTYTDIRAQLTTHGYQ